MTTAPGPQCCPLVFSKPLIRRSCAQNPLAAPHSWQNKIQTSLVQHAGPSKSGPTPAVQSTEPLTVLGATSRPSTPWSPRPGKQRLPFPSLLFSSFRKFQFTPSVLPPCGDACHPMCRQSGVWAPAALMGASCRRVHLSFLLILSYCLNIDSLCKEETHLFKRKKELCKPSAQMSSPLGASLALWVLTRLGQVPSLRAHAMLTQGHLSVCVCVPYQGL